MSSARRLIGTALLAGLLVLLAACGSASVTPAEQTPPPAAGPPSAARLPWPAGVPAADPVRCPAPVVRVSTGEQLRTALRDGARVAADGLYRGEQQIRRVARGEGARRA